MSQTGRTTSRQAPGRVVLLLGAGASVPAGIPDVRRFVEDFKRDMESRGGLEPLLRCYEDLEKSWQASGSTHPLDLERFYELLEWIQGEQIEPPIPLLLARGFPARSRETELLFWELKKYIQLRCLNFGSVDYLKPLADLAKAFTPLTILTLNYDTCVEQVLDRSGLGWSDGFPRKQGVSSPWFLPDFDDLPGRSDLVTLLKLHGSASWYQSRTGWMQRALGRSQHQIGLRLGSARTMTHEAMMVYPTLNKALAEGPFPALLAAAQRVLAHSELCLAIGYAFGDVHIRRLVLGALATQPQLKLVLINPRPTEVLSVLDREPETRRVRDRIGIVDQSKNARGEMEKGFVQNALEGGWLLGRCRALLAGARLPEILPAVRRKSRSEGKWTLRYPIAGGVTSLCWHENAIAYVSSETKEVRLLDSSVGSSRVLSSLFRAPRGLDYDSITSRLYLVENSYRFRSWQPSLFSVPLGGIGRLWAIDNCGRTFPMTRVKLARWLSVAPSALGLGQLPREELWRRLEGAIRWPTSVVVEEPGNSLLVTEAKRLLRFNPGTGELAVAVDIPLCSNLGCLFLESRNSLFLTDAGIFPRGRGRLLWTDLRNPTVQVLAEGWELLGSVLALPRQILVSVGSRTAPGSVLALDRARPDGRPLRQWSGLERPSGLILGQGADHVLLGTSDGIAELTL